MEERRGEGRLDLNNEKEVKRRSQKRNKADAGGTDRRSKQCKLSLSTVDIPRSTRDYKRKYLKLGARTTLSLFARKQHGHPEARSAKTPGLAGPITSRHLHPQPEASSSGSAGRLAWHNHSRVVAIVAEPAPAHSPDRMGSILSVYNLGPRGCSKCTSPYNSPC